MTFRELDLDRPSPAPLKIDEANIQSWGPGFTLSVMLVEKFEGDDQEKFRLKFRGAYSHRTDLTVDLNRIFQYVEKSNERPDPND